MLSLFRTAGGSSLWDISKDSEPVQIRSGLTSSGIPSATLETVNVKRMYPCTRMTNDMSRSSPI